MSTTNSQRRPRHGFAAIAASSAVIIAALGFYAYALGLQGRHGDGHGYDLEASFVSSNGLHPGADVMLAGVPVGQVSSIALDEQTMTARVRFRIGDGLALPTDTALSIGSSTLTSANALLILPGRSPQMLAPGSVVTRTCEATSLEQQISQYIFGNGGAPSNCVD